MVGLAGDRLGADTNAAIAAGHFGSVWFVDVSGAGVAAIKHVTDAVQRLATSSLTGDVRFFVAANQEGGEIQALRGPGFSTIPSAVVQGGMSPATVRSDARRWGGELRAAGVNFDFAPVADVVPPGTQARNAPIGALQRNYGTDDATVAAHADAFVRGMADAGVATSAKHFPGLGRVTSNTDLASGVVDSSTTADDLGTFRSAVSAGVPFVMVALATYQRLDPAHLASFSPTIIQTLLRSRLEFDGVIISDDLGATDAVRSIPPATRALDFLEAGGDMIISKTLAPAGAMFEGVLSRARSDAPFRALVNEAAMRILNAKFASGLLPC